MSPSLEQELEAVVAGSDYRVRLDSGYANRLSVSVRYLPSVRSVDLGGATPLCIENGEIASRTFRGRRRWVKAGLWTRETILGHQAMLRESGVRQL